MMIHSKSMTLTFFKSITYLGKCCNGRYQNRKFAFDQYFKQINRWGNDDILRTAFVNVNEVVEILLNRAASGFGLQMERGSIQQCPGIDSNEPSRKYWDTRAKKEKKSQKKKKRMEEGNDRFETIFDLGSCIRSAASHWFELRQLCCSTDWR